MSTSVTLTWEDDEAAAEFLRLRRDYLENGYIRDVEGEVLQAAVGLAAVTDPPAEAVT